MGSMSIWHWILVLAVVYALARMAGKILGTSIGASWAKAPEAVQKYLGMCMFCQGGVAVGLALIAMHRFSEPIAGVRPGEVVAARLADRHGRAGARAPAVQLFNRPGRVGASAGR